MKKIIDTCLLLIILLMISGCRNADNKLTIIEKNKGIIKVTIESSMGIMKIFEDEEKIKEITTYLNNLDLSTKVSTNTEVYMGMAYTMTVFFDDKTSRVFWLDAHNIFHYGDENYKIPYSQAEDLKVILQ